MQIGTVLTLKLEEDNKYDARAVAIYLGEHKLGFVPRNENRIFYKLLKVGITNFEARVQMIDDKEHPESQVQVVVHLIGA